MKTTDFTYSASDGQPVFVRKWSPAAAPKAVLVVVHGMAEHSARYGRLAEVLTQSGLTVIAPDLRGHGKTAEAGRLGWIAERDGFARICADLRGIIDAVRADEQGAPLFILGHSMGSLIAELLIASDSSGLAGCVLSGVIAPPPPPLLMVGKILAACGAFLKGGSAASPLLHAMSFSANNRDFEPARTECDWLSRDTAEVDAYIADPLCGFVCSFDFYRDLFSGLSLYLRRSPFAQVDKNLPVYIFAGADDPVGGAKGFVPVLADMLRRAGLRDIETRLYPGARHETLNEINRGEVVEDLRNWLVSRIEGAQNRAVAP